MKNPFILSIFLFCQFHLFAQDASSITEFTSRLGQIKSSKAISKGKLLSNLNYSFSDMNCPIQQNKRGTLGLDIGYGLIKNVEIRASLGYAYWNVNSSEWGTPQGEYNHLRYLKFGSTINLFKQKQWVPQIAVSVDFAGENSYFSYSRMNDFNVGNDVVIGLPMSYDFEGGLRLGGSIEYLYNNETRITYQSLMRFSLNGRYELDNGLGAYVEYNLPTNFQDYGFASSGSVGVFYRVNERVLLDVGYYRFKENQDGWINNDGVIDFQVIENQFSLGFSWLMLNN